MNVRPEIGGVGLLIGLAFAVLMIIIAVVIWWKIFAKAGYGGALGLLMFIPVINLIMLLVLAFGEWPVQREVKQLRQQLASMPQGYYPPQQGYNQPPQGYYPQQGYNQPPQGYNQPPQGNRPMQ